MTDTERVGFHISDEKLQGDTPIDVLASQTPFGLYGEHVNEIEKVDWKVIVVLAIEGYGIQVVEDYIAKLQLYYPNTQIVGGVVASSLMLIQHGIVNFYDNGIIGVAISGDVVFSSQVSAACKPLTNTGTILDVDNVGYCDVITYIRDQTNNIRNAISFFYDDLDDVEIPYAPFIGITNDEAKGFKRVDVDGQTSEGGILVPTNEVKEGDLVRMFTIAPDAAQEDIHRRLQAAKDRCRLQSKRVLGGLLFTCSGRGYSFYKAKDVESKLFAKLLPNVGMSGFFAGN